MDIGIALMQKGERMSDLISRKAVLDYPIRLDHYDEEHGNRHFVLGIESVMEYVESLPSADRQRWIPCSERLPELTPANELQHYIVTIKKECGLRDEVYDAFYLGNGWQIGDMIMLEKNDVLAWMPLPKPYREDGEA